MDILLEVAFCPGFNCLGQILPLVGFRPLRRAPPPLLATSHPAPPPPPLTADLDFCPRFALQVQPPGRVRRITAVRRDHHQVAAVLQVEERRRPPAAALAGGGGEEQHPYPPEPPADEAAAEAGPELVHRRPALDQHR